MNFAEIARRTTPATARKLKSDSYFNKHIAGQGQDVDGERLDDLTRGAVVLGVEPVDYPLTDGLYIYMKRPTGDVIALLIEPDADETGGGCYEILRISKTDVA